MLFVDCIVTSGSKCFNVLEDGIFFGCFTICLLIDTPTNDMQIKHTTMAIITSKAGSK